MPHDPTPIDLDLLDRYLAGAAAPHERAMVESWIDAHQSHRAFIDALQRELPEAREPRPLDEHALLADLHARIERDRVLPHPGAFAPAETRRARLTRIAWRVAAAVLVTATVVLAWRNGSRTDGSAARPIAVREIATRRGQRAELRLADGTQVVLGAESRLRIPANDERDLVLYGEGYFMVTHDSAHPFRVRTATGVVEDVGTEFVVTAYSETHGTRVAVRTGSVSVRRLASRAERARRLTDGIVTPVAMVERGDVAYLDSTGRVTLTHNADLAPYLGWTDGHLEFNGVAFSDAIPVLERWYDVQIEVRDSTLARQHLIASFHDESTADVLRRIALALGARVDRHGRVAVFTARPHPAHS